MDINTDTIKHFFYLDDQHEWIIRQNDNVDVRRHKDENGQIRYVKIFKPGMGYWTKHELRFLKYFSSLDTLPKYTVVPVVVFLNTDGSVEKVETWEAGYSLDRWMGLTAYHADQTEGPAQTLLADAIDILKLIRVCLLALVELETHGIVHCDIKVDNICVPYYPDDPLAAQGIRLQYSRLRLIDFAFSVKPTTAEWTLAECLPMNPDPIGDEQSAGKHFSPLLREVLRQDQKNPSSTPTHWKRLNHSVDLYALGIMLARLLDTVPTVQDAHQQQATSQLKQLSEEWQTRYADGLQKPCYLDYVARLETLLRDLFIDPASWEISAPWRPVTAANWTLPRQQKAEVSPTPISPNKSATPTTPIIKPKVADIPPPVIQARGEPQPKWQRWLLAAGVLVVVLGGLAGIGYATLARF